jgi:3D (Asp-Asp-Asp) domain-containing protein
MKTHLRVFAIVVFILVIGCGTASAYSNMNTQSVIVNVDSVPHMVSTEQTTVGALLKELENVIGTDYFLEDADEDDPVESMMTISLTSVTEKIVANVETMPYDTIRRPTLSMKIGESRVVQKGLNGQMSIVNKETYHGNELIDSEFIEEKVLVAPQDEIIEVGSTGIIDGMSFSKAINARVTAYTPSDPGCTGITATGTVAGHGTIAVDPSVIPFGTTVYIPGYGVAIAEDTGGAIIGHRIDVCFESTDDALEWGVQNLSVYILS